MKKQINDLLLKMQNGENCIDETANQLVEAMEQYAIDYYKSRVECYPAQHEGGMMEMKKGGKYTRTYVSTI